MALTTRTLAILAAATLLVSTVACSPQPPSQPTTIVYGTPMQPNTLNPITAPDLASRYAIEMIFDGLVAADDKLQLREELATGWNVSPDGKEWTFQLRKGVRWHDGRDFTAEDVKFTYETVIDPNTKPTVSKADYASIRRIDVVDPYTVRFSLAQPNSSFLSKLTLGIAPKHLLQGQDLATSSFNTRPVGTGPFIFESWQQGESLVLKRNPGYFGAVPKVERLVWKVVPDASVLSLQTVAGEVDGAPVLNMRDVAAIRGSGKMALHETQEGNTQISLQLKNPLFQDVRVRQALAFAVDTQALIDGIMQGGATPATSDIPPSSWAYNPDVPRYPYSQDRARALLAEAGWKPGPDGVLAKDGKRFEFTLMTDAGHKAREQVMMAVKQNWTDLGLDVRASVQERNSFVSQRVLKGDFDAVLLQTSVQIDPDLTRRFHSSSITSGQNFLNYRNPEVDRLLQEALLTSDQEARRQAYFTVQRILATDLPQISLYYPKTLYAFKTGITGIKPSPINLFWNAEEWAWK